MLRGAGASRVRLRPRGGYNKGRGLTLPTRDNAADAVLALCYRPATWVRSARQPDMARRALITVLTRVGVNFREREVERGSVVY